MGKLIVIEGTDGSGKETHSKRLAEQYRLLGYKVKRITFPNYESKSSEPIKMYLNGEIGDLSDMNPYPISAMYAIDRYISFKQDWQSFYEEENTIIIADRYTTSNMVHQAAKLNDMFDKQQLVEYIKQMEYRKFSLPKPDLTIFLNMKPEHSMELRKSRGINKINNTEELDIHESNLTYMAKSYVNGLQIATLENWSIVDCFDEHNNLKTIDSIFSECMDLIHNKIIK